MAEENDLKHRPQTTTSVSNATVLASVLVPEETILDFAFVPPEVRLLSMLEEVERDLCRGRGKVLAWVSAAEGEWAIEGDQDMREDVSVSGVLKHVVIW